MLGYILYTCPNLECNPCSKCYGTDCFGTYTWHMSKPVLKRKSVVSWRRFQARWFFLLSLLFFSQNVSLCHQLTHHYIASWDRCLFHMPRVNLLFCFLGEMTFQSRHVFSIFWFCVSARPPPMFFLVCSMRGQGLQVYRCFVSKNTQKLKGKGCSGSEGQISCY